MLVLACECNDLFNLGRSDVAGEYPADAPTLVMNFEHDLRCLFSIQRKKPLENGDNELHGCVIVIQQHYLIHSGWAQLVVLCNYLSAFLSLCRHAFDFIQSAPIRN